jgi:hypothetical protein
MLLLAHESRKSIEEASAALRSGECRTFSSCFSMGSDNMIDIADRLIAAGLGEEVWKAGVYASTKGELLTPGKDRDESYEILNPAHELLEVIHACNDPAELNALWDHVFASLWDREEAEDSGDDADDLIVAADELLEAGDTEAVRAAHAFALKRLDTMDPRSARYGQQVESTENDLLKLLSDMSDDSSLMVFVDHVEERLQIAA